MTRGLLLALALTAVLLLVACGSDSTEALTPTPAPTIAPTLVPSPTFGGTPRPTLRDGAPGTPADFTPTNEEIARARASMGFGLIGVIACTLSTEYHSIVAADAQARAEALGFRIEVFDSQAKAERQPAAIENFIARDAKVIVLCALDPQAISGAVKRAEDAGILIIQYGGDALKVNGVTVGGEENAALGCAAGEIAGDLIAREKGGRATVAILDYPTLPQIVVRADNIENCLKAKAAGATVVGRYQGGTTDNGLASMQAALKGHPDIDVVVSINDAGAYGALSALQTAGKDSKRTIVVGIDGETRAKELIRKGDFYRGSVDTSPSMIGRLVIDAAVKLLASATVPRSVRVPVTKITAETLH
jgi:ribose transport system substrate-binding protein